jgi:hypothetical protein
LAFGRSRVLGLGCLATDDRLSTISNDLIQLTVANQLLSVNWYFTSMLELPLKPSHKLPRQVSIKYSTGSVQIVTEPCAFVS